MSSNPIRDELDQIAKEKTADEMSASIIALGGVIRNLQLDRDALLVALKLVRSHPDECLGDRPEWIKFIDGVIASVARRTG